MMNAKLKRVLTHPIIQGISFSILVFPGQEFDIPFLIAIRWSYPAPFAVLAIAGLLCTLVSIFFLRRPLQLLGLVLLWTSLIIFTMQLNPSLRASMSVNPVTLLTALQFLFLSLFTVFEKYYGRTA